MNGKQAKFLRSIKASKAFKKKYKAWPHYVRGIYRGMMSVNPLDVPFTGKDWTQINDR